MVFGGPSKDWDFASVSNRKEDTDACFESDGSLFAIVLERD